MAAAFGVRLLGTALVVNFDSAAMIGEGAHLGPLPQKSVESGDDDKGADGVAEIMQQDGEARVGIGCTE